jgi:hypothetical protein
MTTLSFYDHQRQSYAGNVPLREAGEFMIGGYEDEGGVDERGEFAVVLHRFSETNVHDFTGPNIPAATLSPQIQAFDDSFGALRECIALGLLDALESATIYTAADLTGILTDLGLRDRSHNPVEA